MWLKRFWFDPLPAAETGDQWQFLAQLKVYGNEINSILRRTEVRLPRQDSCASKGVGSPNDHSVPPDAATAPSPSTCRSLTFGLLDHASAIRTGIPAETQRELTSPRKSGPFTLATLILNLQNSISARDNGSLTCLVLFEQIENKVISPTHLGSIAHGCCDVDSPG